MPVLATGSGLGPFLTPQGAEWIAILAAYLLGSVPFGLVLARLKGIDLRRVGSGNIGATNAARALGRPLGLTAFALDFAKGAVPVVFFAPALALSEASEPSLAVLAGLAAVIGHVFPVYLGGRGGKAVATGCGMVVALDPLVFVLGGGVWLLVVGGLRYVSLASLAMCATFPVVAWQRAAGGIYGSEVFWGTLVLFLLVLVRHRANLARLFAGREPRFGQRRTEEPRP